MGESVAASSSTPIMTDKNVYPTVVFFSEKERPFAEQKATSFPKC